MRRVHLYLFISELSPSGEDVKVCKNKMLIIPVKYKYLHPSTIELMAVGRQDFYDKSLHRSSQGNRMSIDLSYTCRSDNHLPGRSNPTRCLQTICGLMWRYSFFFLHVLHVKEILHRRMILSIFQ